MTHKKSFLEKRYLNSSYGKFSANIMSDTYTVEMGYINLDGKRWSCIKVLSPSYTTFSSKWQSEHQSCIDFSAHDILPWCAKNISGRWFYQYGIFLFEDNDDAALVMLRFK